MKKNIAHPISRGLRRCAVILAITVPAIASAAEERIALDAWTGTGGAQSSNTGIIATYALTNSLYKSGFRVIGGASAGNYDFQSTRSPTGTVQGRYTEFFAQLGYNFAGPAGSLTIAAGPTVSNTNLSFVTPGSTTGEKRGVRTSLTGYMPVGNGGFLLGGASHSTADASNYYMAKMGFDVLNGLKFGPEASLAKGRDYSEQRLGLHLTGFKVGKVALGISAGARQDQDNRRGGYIQASGRATF